MPSVSFPLAASLLLGAFFWMAGLPGAARAEPCAMRELPGGTIEEVIDGDTARLADGREIRFVGIQAPKLALGRKGFMPWPLAEEARAAAADLLLGKEVALRVDGRSVDRHGRVLAHIFAGEEKIWAQRALVGQGWARVYSFADNHGCTLELLEAEGAARRALRGIWAHPFYAVRRADDLKKLEGLTGSFQLVEGAVADVTELKGYELKRVMPTGTVASLDNRNWELRDHSGPVQRLSQSRAVALDMESATIAANGFRFRVPYGTLLCVSDKPLHGELKLPGMASDFYKTQVSRHLMIGIKAMESLREMPLERIHSRKLRSFEETAFL